MSRRQLMRRAGAVSAGLLVLVVALAARNSMTARRGASGFTDTGCESEPSTIAHVHSAVGKASVRCQPWDIGTGVSGYVWQAPVPRAVVLLVAGWGDYSQRHVTQSSAIIPRLLELGVTVHAFDLWGNGRSPGVRGATDIRAAVNDHLAARQKLRAQSLPVFLLGHSVGGLVTATSVLDDPVGVQGLILVAPALRWEVPRLMRTTARIVSAIVPGRPVPVPAADPALQSSDTLFLRRLHEDSLYHHGGLTWITAATGATTAHRNWTRYASLSVPTLVVTGSDDQVTPPDAARAFVDLVGATDKTLQVTPGGRHSLLDDPPASAAALTAMLDWLGARLPEGGPPVPRAR